MKTYFLIVLIVAVIWLAGSMISVIETVWENPFTWPFRLIKFLTSALTAKLRTVTNCHNGPSKARLKQPYKTMTRVHLETMNALLPFCKEKTRQVRTSSPVAAGSASQKILSVLRDESGDTDTIRAAINILHHAGVIGQVTKTAFDTAHSAYVNDEEIDSSSAQFPVGSVVVCIGGTRENKRVLNRGYLIVDQDGSRPVPLGLRGQAENGRRPFEAAHIRAATDAEISDTLTRLTAAQLKMLVCELSADEPFRSVLSGVIENNGAACRS